ncbi:AtpZ/AtpI family protein [Chloroflexota bacterium]
MARERHRDSCSDYSIDDYELALHPGNSCILAAKRDLHHTLAYDIILEHGWWVMGRRPLAALRFIGIGFYIGGCVFGGAYGGRWLGRAMDSEVFFTIAGVGVGLLIAFLGVYNMLRSIMAERRDKNRGSG